MLSVVWLALIHFKVTLKSLEKIVFLYLQVIRIYYTYLDFIPNPMTYLYKYCIVFILYLHCTYIFNVGRFISMCKY